MGSRSGNDGSVFAAFMEGARVVAFLLKGNQKNRYQYDKVGDLWSWSLESYMNFGWIKVYDDVVQVEK